MKKLFKVLLLASLVSTGIIQTNEIKAQSASVSFSIFYNSLKPYGHWVNHGSYGQVWVSNTRGFTPYSTGGHWAYTDYGWTWVSDYDWGWAPFHYGRWAHESSMGWYWVPGYEWGPAWVAWRNSNDYYGWAPLSPGLSISVGIGSYNAIPNDRWVFAPHRYITSPYISRYYAPRTQNVTIIRRTTIVNNVTVRNNVHYAAGPRREDVERVNHTRIQTLTISNSSRPGKTIVNHNTVNVYRPVINNNKTVVNNNTTVNKNSNNTTTTVNKNSNNTSVTKNNNKTTVNNKSTNVSNNSNNKTEKNSTTNNTTNNNTAKKKVQPVKKPTDNSSATNQQKVQGKRYAAKSKASNLNPQQKQKVKDEVAKRKNNQDNNPGNNQRRK
ncbi:MAG: hypothetical protein JO072_16000 [Parafilimonas sp.]|nr:hypothetical protein [Parafilimonas sp.]